MPVGQFWVTTSQTPGKQRVLLPEVSACMHDTPAGPWVWRVVVPDRHAHSVAVTLGMSVAMPGSTEEEMRTQVTDRIDKKLQELSNRKLTRLETFPGRAVAYLELQDRVRGRAVADTWVRVRNMMNDIRGDFP